MVYLERLLFSRVPHGQRARHARFFVLAVTLGIGLAVVFGYILYTLTQQGRLA